MDFMDMRESLSASGDLAMKAIGQGFIGVRPGAMMHDSKSIAFMATTPQFDVPAIRSCEMRTPFTSKRESG